eukprot:12276930-Alexandrium_andersonii.AAC.1
MGLPPAPEKPESGPSSSRFLFLFGSSPELPSFSLSLGLSRKSMGFRFLRPADAARPELAFPAWRQLRGMGVRLEVD